MQLPGVGEAMVEIQETTVGELNGIAVGAGNFWKRDYLLPDGRIQHGLSALIFVNGDRIIVGKGSVFRILESDWEVTDVSKAEELGTISVRQLHLL